MPQLTLSNTLTQGTTANATDVQGNFDDIVTLLNTTKLDADNFQSGIITNALVSSSAAIATSKLATTTAGYVLLGAASTGVPTFAAMSGDATITGGGVLTIANDAVENAMIADSAVDTDQLAADAVTGAKIEDDAVNSEHIADGAIDLAHMSANSVDSDQYVDGSIDTAHLADDQVTPAKMALVNYQTDNANSIASVINGDVKIQSGWIQIEGDATGSIAESVTFPAAFTTVLGVVATHLGAKGSAAATITDLTVDPSNVSTAVAGDITTTGFTGWLFRESAYASGSYYGLSWIAWGV